jgi:hypothetical protein
MNSLLKKQGCLALSNVFSLQGSGQEVKKSCWNRQAVWKSKQTGKHSWLWEVTNLPRMRECNRKTVMCMVHEDFVKLQDETLWQVVNLLKTEPAVVGLVLYGSLVDGLNDAFSDIDLICYLSASDESTLISIIGRIERIHPLLSRLWIYGKNSLFLFRNGIRLDLDLLPQDEIGNLQADRMKILYDPLGKMSAGIPAKKVIPPPHPRYFQQGEALTDWFFWMFRQVYCWVKRGAQNRDRAFEKLYAAFMSLNEMRQTLMEMRRWTLGTNENWQEADSAFTAMLAGTFSSLNPDDMLETARALLAAFEYACGAYCAKCGIMCPNEKITTIRTLLDIFDTLD